MFIFEKPTKLSGGLTRNTLKRLRKTPRRLVPQVIRDCLGGHVGSREHFYRFAYAHLRNVLIYRSTRGNLEHAREMAPTHSKMATNV